MLKFYVRHGMIVDKVHEIISFKQSNWLEKYIDFHAKKRAEATNDFQIEFHKQMPNSFYGKQWKMLEIDVKLNLLKKMTMKKLLNNKVN